MAADQGVPVKEPCREHEDFLVITPANRVPEPGTFALLGLGLAGLGLSRRRKAN